MSASVPVSPSPLKSALPQRNGLGNQTRRGPDQLAFPAPANVAPAAGDLATSTSVSTASCPMSYIMLNVGEAGGAGHPVEVDRKSDCSAPTAWGLKSSVCSSSRSPKIVSRSEYVGVAAPGVSATVSLRA